MKLHILFVQHEESYLGEIGPTAVTVWDEFCVNENPEGFHNAVRDQLGEIEDSIVSHRVITVEVDQGEIRRLLMENPSIKGKIVTN